MEKNIEDLNQQISKSIDEISKDFEQKYREFLPSYLMFDDCQKKVMKTINEGNEQLKKIEAKINSVEEMTNGAKEESPHVKQQVVQEFLNQLKILSEMEHSLNQLWILPAATPLVDNDVKMVTDPLASAHVIIRLEELCEKLESESKNNHEAVNERILPLMFVEIRNRRAELAHQLDDFYRGFLSFTDNDRVNPPMTVMSIAVPSEKTASDYFTALQTLGMFEEHLEAFVDTVWEHFCQKLIYGQAKDKLKINVDKFATGRTMHFEIPKKMEITQKPEPAGVFSDLTQFFDALEQALHGIRVCDRTLVELFGECICDQLISSLEKGCLNSAIPFEKDKAKIVYTQLTKLTQDFLQFMQEQGFFVQPVSNMFKNIFSSYERVSINRRCHHYITTARDLVKQQYLELVDVGSAKDLQEEKAAEIIQKMEENMRITADNAESTTSTKWDKSHTKLFQFQHCKISQSTFKLVNLVQEVLHAAAEAESKLEACQLITTAQNILEMFVTLAPEYHKNALSSVPQIAAIFFNNCHYISHRLMSLPVDVMQKVMEVSKISQQNLAFTGTFVQLRVLAEKTMEMHVVNARRQLSATIGDKDIFEGLRDDRTHKRCQKTLHACMMQIQQIADVWKEVMPAYVYAQSMGALVSHLLTVLADFILRKEDITSSDAEISAELLEQLVEQLKDLLTIDNKPMIQKVCEEPYYRLLEIIFCLKANLSEIANRWCEGQGPLATWMKAPQVKQLIRALFQNTDRRARLLGQIN